MAAIRALADLRWYVVGAAIAFAVMWTIAFVPDKATVYLLLGLMPFVVEICPPRMRPNIEWRGVPFVTGIFTTIIQFLAGVGGLFLDIFFQKSRLDRKTTNATKAVAQTFSHVLRAPISARWRASAICRSGRPGRRRAGDRGHWLAPYVMERMTDHGFRQWTRAIIFTIGMVYLVRAAWLFWRG